VKSRRWRHGGVPCLALLCGLGLATQGLAACPVDKGFSAVSSPPPLQLAWRPLLQDGTAIAPELIPMARHFLVEVQLCDGAGPSPATLSRIDATMPAHRHGMNYRPRIRQVGAGRFRVEGMMFHMSGDWRLEFELTAGTEVQRLFHDLAIR